MPEPIIPHELFGADCPGALVKLAGSQFVCNECETLIPSLDVQREMSKMESAEAICPHCGVLNHFLGMVDVSAFVCDHCDRGVGL